MIQPNINYNTFLKTMNCLIAQLANYQAKIKMQRQKA